MTYQFLVADLSRALSRKKLKKHADCGYFVDTSNPIFWKLGQSLRITKKNRKVEHAILFGGAMQNFDDLDAGLVRCRTSYIKFLTKLPN